jgi:translation initiation factor IF-3
MTHPEIGRRMLSRVSEQLGEWGTVELEPKFEGRTMVMVLSPRSGSKTDQ